MVTVSQQIFYTPFIIQNFLLTSMAYDIQTDIDMTMNKKRIEPWNIKENEENLIVQYSTIDKIKNIFNKLDYEAIMDMKNKLMDFFEFPFKYLNKTFHIFTDNKKSGLKNLSDRIRGDNNASSTEVTKVIEVNIEVTKVTEVNTEVTKVTEVNKVAEICSMPPKFLPTWCLIPQH